ncbi:MAG: molybdopterin-dependent oxidoreductase [Acidobacteria bacterium]|nr:molybdopterin-dependent oxidoreductase [Acidobacteriota bacterium]
MDRRSFIKLTAVTGASAALASCGNPENQLIRFVPDEDIVPGIAVWKPGVCPLCAAGCGLTVRVMDADAEVVRNGQLGIVRIAAAKKLEGAPNHPVNRGGLCARGQAAIQITYHPDRITQPLKRAGERGDGRYEAISWDDALGEVVSRLDALEAAGTQRALAFLSRGGAGHRAALIEQFLARFGAPPPLVYELFGDEVLRRANAVSFGREQLPTLDLANARFVLSFGADFLGTWNSPVAQSVAYGAMRQGRPGIRGGFVQVESRMSQTGANADEWIPARPGTEGVLALGLAHVIVAAGLRPASAASRAGALIDGWSDGLQGYAPEQVEKITGVAAARVDRLGRQFAEMRPSVAIVAGPPLAHTNGFFTAVAVNALNALVGNIEQPGGVFFTPQLDLAAALKMKTPVAGAPAPPFRLQPEGDEDDPHIGDAQVLFVDGANPVFTAPRLWRIEQALAKAPYIVSFGSFLDETAVRADLILPDHSFLEAWSGAVPESGATVAVASVAPPVMRPLYQTRATPDVLLDIGRRLRRPLNLPWQTFEEMLAAAFAALPSATRDVDAWTDAQGKGMWSGTLPAGLGRAASLPAPPAARPLAYEAPSFDGDAGEYPFHFLPYPSTTFLDGSLAHLPWLQEMPDPLTSAMWSSWVEINPATAERLGIGQGDVVEIASAHGSVRAAAILTPGIAPDMVAMPAGQGHRTFTRYASGRGSNPVEVIAPVTEPATGALAWAATRVRVTRVGPPDGSLILFAGGMREHPEEHR